MVVGHGRWSESGYTCKTALEEREARVKEDRHFAKQMGKWGHCCLDESQERGSVLDMKIPWKQRVFGNAE